MIISDILPENIYHFYKDQYSYSMEILLVDKIFKILSFGLYAFRDVIDNLDTLIIIIANIEIWFL